MRRAASYRGMRAHKAPSAQLINTKLLGNGGEVLHLVSHKEVVEDEAGRKDPGVAVPATKERHAGISCLHIVGKVREEIVVPLVRKDALAHVAQEERHDQGSHDRRRLEMRLCDPQGHLLRLLVLQEILGMHCTTAADEALAQHKWQSDEDPLWRGCDPRPVNSGSHGVPQVLDHVAHAQQRDDEEQLPHELAGCALCMLNEHKLILLSKHSSCLITAQHRPSRHCIQVCPRFSSKHLSKAQSGSLNCAATNSVVPETLRAAAKSIKSPMA